MLRNSLQSASIDLVAALVPTAAARAVRTIARAERTNPGMQHRLNLSLPVTVVRQN